MQGTRFEHHFTGKIKGFSPVDINIQKNYFRGSGGTPSGKDG